MVRIVEDYDMSVIYHPVKANVIANSQISMTMGNVSHVNEVKKDLVKDVHRLARLGVRLDDLNSGYMVHHNSESSLVAEVKSK